MHTYIHYITLHYITYVHTYIRTYVHTYIRACCIYTYIYAWFSFGVKILISKKGRRVMNVDSYQFLDQRETQPIKNPLRSRPINK